MAANTESRPEWPRLLQGGGETGSRLRSIDWASTSMGEPANWPSALNTTLSILLASTQPMFLLWGDDRVYLYNDAYAPLIGIKHPKALGAPYLDIWAEQLPRLSPLLDAVFGRGESLSIDDMSFDIDQPDGLTQEKYFSFSITPVRDDGGGIAGLFCVCVESTDQIEAGRQVEKAMRALTDSERRYRTLFESMTEGFCVIERIEGTEASPSDFQYVVVNPAFGKVTFVKDALGRTIRELFPNEADAWVETYEGVLTRRTATLFERRLTEASRDLEIYAYPVLENARQVAVVFSDITTRKDAERRREEGEALILEAKANIELHRDRLQQQVEQRTSALSAANAALEDAIDFTRRVTNMIPARIAYFDPDKVCRFANQSFCDWVRRDNAQVIGETMSSLFSDPAVIVSLLPIEETLNGAPQRFERQVQRLDGSFEHFLIDCVPEPRTDPWQRRGTYLHAVDITALKAAERRLKLLNADLERARDDSHRANQAKSAFLANMSHEIRTPLNGILGMTHILSREIVDVEQQRQLDKVRDAAQHLRGLIDDILDLSKIEAEKLTLEVEAFEIADAIARALAMVQGAAVEKGLRLSVEIQGLPRIVLGDRLRFSQIVLNLLSNAVKFTVKGHVTLRGRVLERSNSQVRLKFEVDDSGPGIAATSIPKLFEAFEQADNSITRQHGGTGLGLALSRQLARAMGGDAGVSSELGVGSVFWFTVSLDEVLQEVGQRQPDSAVASTSTRSDFEQAESLVRQWHSGRRILLAEDNPINREVGTRLLNSAGLDVQAVEDGQAAVALAQTVGFDLVLMDMQMPTMDGLAATREIRTRLPSLPIIAMTANAYQEDRDACLAAGMNDHIGKPVDPVALYSMLMKWLPKRVT